MIAPVSVKYLSEKLVKRGQCFKAKGVFPIIALSYLYEGILLLVRRRLYIEMAPVPRLRKRATIEA